jgi:hypothetical protein
VLAGQKWQRSEWPDIESAGMAPFQTERGKRDRTRQDGEIKWERPSGRRFQCMGWASESEAVAIGGRTLAGEQPSRKGPRQKGRCVNVSWRSEGRRIKDESLLTNGR